MTMNRIILGAAVLSVLGAAPSVRAQECCLEIPAYTSESGTQACQEGDNKWTCPAVRAHYPVQRACNDNRIGPMICHARRAPVMIPVFSVRCGTFQNRCPDGLPAAFRTPAKNDLCGDKCVDRIGTSADCEQSKRAWLKEQADELERLLREAMSPPEG